MKRIAIHSAPRSGSTWLGSIFDSHPNVAYRFQPLFSYGHKSQLNEESTKNDIDRFFNDILQTTDDFVLQKEAIEKKIVPHFRKDSPTHLVYKEVRYHNIIENLLEKDNEIKIIGLIRNPLAVINSWLRAPKEFKKELGWKESEEWRYAPKKNLNKSEEFNGFEKWKEVSHLFLNLNKKFPERFKLINYDELIINTQKTAEELFKFCNLNLSPQTIQFISTSKTSDNKDAYSVYKTKTSDTGWKKTLPEYISKEILNDTDFKRLNKIFNWI
jgi:hypothetical protein